VNIHKYGNTSAATIPIALSEAVAEGRVGPGSKLVFVAFGAGLTWGACAFEWGQRIEPISTVPDELDAPTEGALEQMLRQQSLFA
jgi:3-oxoacyl-[acyl-carrier-protein] synthase-3